MATYPVLSSADSGLDARSEGRACSPEAQANAAVTELFAAQGDGVYRLAMVMLGRRADAEDVVQETFLRLLRHTNEGGALTNARGWIYTVAAHLCRDRQRAARRWLPWLAERDGRVSSDRSDRGDQRDALRQAIAHLSSRDRLLIFLRAQGLSYEEIGAAAGVRNTSVGRTLSRALERFEREIRKSGVRP